MTAYMLPDSATTILLVTLRHTNYSDYAYDTSIASQGAFELQVMDKN